MKEKAYDIFLNETSLKDLSITRCDFVDTTIENHRADNLNLEAVLFDKVNLRDLLWRNCRLSRVTFSKASLSSVVIRMCQLEQVYAPQIQVDNSKLENCKVNGTDFHDATFSDSSLTDGDFNRSNFSGACFSKVDASYCNMRGVDFRGATIIDCNFRDADLRGADFTGAHIENSDFRGANIDGALFDRSEAEPTNTQNGDDLLDIVDPVVRNFIGAAAKKELVDEAQTTAELDQVMQSLFGSRRNQNTNTQLSADIDKIMTSISNVGIGPLLDSLQQHDSEPPAAVKSLIRDLMKNRNLPDDATTEDLLSSLIDGVNKQ